MHYEAIIIGAGPAGGAAAYACAAAGMKTALIEKYVLPRHKTCGGGMPMVMQETLRDLAPDAFVESTVRYMRHTLNFSEPHLAPMNPPGAGGELSLWMVRRSVFDNALAERAARAGADVCDGLTVKSIVADSTGCRVRAEGKDGRDLLLTADHVIGADGANGVAAKAAGLRRNRVLAIALEVEQPHRWEGGHPDLRPDVAHLEYGAVHRGYAWVFPKGDHLNVGAGLFRPRSKDGRGDAGTRDLLRSTVCRYMDYLEVPYREAELQWHAHPLPIWNGREPLNTPDGRILLAGDSAGLINPFFGDGILHAVKSGLIAAQSLSDGSPAEYTARIHAEFAANFDAALKLAKFFYQWTGLCYRYAVSREHATRTATRLLCGEAMFSDVTGRVLRRLRRALLDKNGLSGSSAGAVVD